MKLIYNSFLSSIITRKNAPYLLILLFILCSAATCQVGLNNTSIRAELNTFYIKDFALNAPSAPPTIGQEFSQRLQDKIRQESRLSYTETKPDVEIEGTITGFVISAVAPRPGETTQLSRLTISMRVDYIDNKDESFNWENANFSFAADFEADQNLVDIQDRLIEEIFDQIATEIFQKAFGSW